MKPPLCDMPYARRVYRVWDMKKDGWHRSSYGAQAEWPSKDIAVDRLVRHLDGKPLDELECQGAPRFKLYELIFRVDEINEIISDDELLIILKGSAT